MNFKGNPDYVTTSEVASVHRRSRSWVQKMEASGKLPRAGVEGGVVYYNLRDSEAIADDKAYGTALATKRDDPSPPLYPSLYMDGYSSEVELRRWERTMMQRIEELRRPAQPEATNGVQRQLERIGDGFADYVREQRESRQAEQERAQRGGIKWGVLLGAGAIGLLAWAYVVEMRNRAEVEQWERNREFELKFKLMLGPASEAEFEEYLALHWKSSHPADVPWEHQTVWTRRKFTLRVKFSLCIATEEEKAEYKSTWGWRRQTSFAPSITDTGDTTRDEPSVSSSPDSQPRSSAPPKD